ncbi:MAG: hypothetical protein WC956_09955, partial [bacterium]
MRKISTIIVATLVLLAPTLCAAQLCVNPIPIKSTYSDAAKINKIKTALAAPCTYLNGQVCEVCFVGDAPTLSMNAVPVSTVLSPNGFVLQIPNTEKRDIQVVGLKLKNSLSQPIAVPFLKISHNGTGKVGLDALSLADVKQGLSIEGSGKTEVVNAQIAGDASKFGFCYSVNADNAKLDGITATSCKEGVAIHANDVSIVNKSVIKDNKLGVHVYDNFIGTDIRSSKIYFNSDGDNTNLWRNDGVRIEGGAPFAPSFH